MKNFRRVFAVAIIALGSVMTGMGQTSDFNYQGSLNFSGQPANGNYDMEFALFDSLSGGAQAGGTVTRTNVSVANGVFVVSLNFGGAFTGANRFLEIRVRPAGGGAYTPLAPRQSVASSPYAIRSASASVADTAATATNATNAANATTAATATNALSLGGVAANQYVLSGDARLSDARTPTAGSANYIQNTATQQASSNFNISGDGTAGGTLSGNILNAATQFNLNNQRILSAGGTNNLFGGVGSGANVTSGVLNTFFGAQTGTATNTGDGNAFFGGLAGVANTIGDENSFFGMNAGLLNSTGLENTFLGAVAGRNTTSGSFNTMIGSRNGTTNTTGGGITLLGSRTNVLADGLSNAAAIGFRAAVSQGNSLVLGSVNGVNGATANTNVGIGTTAPGDRLHVVGNGLFDGNLTVTGTISGTLPGGSSSYIQNTTSQQSSSNFNISGNGTVGGTLSANIVRASTQFNISGNRVLAANVVDTFVGVGAGSSNTSGTLNSFFGGSAGFDNTAGSENSFFGYQAGVNSNSNGNSFFGTRSGLSNFNGLSNSFFGTDAGRNNFNGSGNTFVGERSDFLETDATGDRNTALGAKSLVTSGLIYQTAIGANAMVTQSNSLVLGAIFGVNGSLSDTNVGIGTTAPADRLHVVGIVRIGSLGTAGTTPLCRNPSHQIATCSSSLRYKENIAPFAPGLSLVRQLQPISYEWKANGNKDVGFGAEDVAKIDPRFVTYNDKGEVEGIKYDRLSVAFVNAFREQQAELEAQKAKIEAQRSEIDVLKQYICLRDANASFCKEKK